MRGLADAGFRIPSPVQRSAIPLGRLGADLVVQAKSGTGKTVTFGAILLDRVDRTLPHPQALVVSPTREVALQSHAVIQTLAASLLDPPLRLHACLGGLPVAADRAALAKGCHAVVGTPGRVRQLLEEGALRPDGIRAFVLDEADALMGGSFEADVLFAHSMLPERKQVMAFSATYPDAARGRLESLMRWPELVSVSARGDTALRAVRQFYVDVDARPDLDGGVHTTHGRRGHRLCRLRLRGRWDSNPGPSRRRHGSQKRRRCCASSRPWRFTRLSSSLAAPRGVNPSRGVSERLATPPFTSPVISLSRDEWR